jgi:hypothetical protein
MAKSELIPLTGSSVSRLAWLWWFHKMGAPGSAALARQVAPRVGEKINAEDPNELQQWSDVLDHLEQTIAGNHDELIRWLVLTWQMTETTLTHWTVDDLAKTYRHIRDGKI